MRKLLLVTAAFAAFTMSGCSTIEKWTGDEQSAPPPPSASAKPPTTSDAEAKEMSSVMGTSDVGTSDNPTPPAVPVEAVTTDDGASAGTGSNAAASDNDAQAQAQAGPAPANAPKECPQVEVLPDTKSITYFDDPDGKPNGALVARAVLTDIKGGCDYSKDGVIVDIDMIMQGKITDKGRYQGRDDLEAFMTFPYFVAVMDPSGKMIDKKIMATAMRFKPQVDDLDHAEKITQSIPMTDIKMGPKYTITLGFQLNRAQLEYNRGGAGAASPSKSAAPAPSKKTSSNDSKPSDGKTAAKAQPVIDAHDTAQQDMQDDDAPKSASSSSDGDRYSKGDLGLTDDSMPSVVDPASGDASGAQ